MRIVVIGFLLGILICQQLASLPEQLYCWLLSIAAIILLILSLYNKFSMLLWLGGISLGLVWMCWQASNILAQNLPPTLIGKNINIQGYILDLPVQTDKYTQFNLRINKLEYSGQVYDFKAKVRFRWYGNKLRLKPGQLWSFNTKLKPVHTIVNFGVADPGKYLFMQRIRATANLNKNSAAQLLAETKNINLWRYYLVQHLKSGIKHLPNAGIILSIAVGDRSLMRDEQWDWFRATGAVHLVAISGLHVSSLGLFGFGLGSIFWKLVLMLGLINHKLPLRQFALILSLILVSIYILISGFSISAQRAYIMLLGILLPILLNYSLSSSQRIALALAFVLVYDPLATLSVGFWLSFTLVSLIIYLYTFTPKAKPNIIYWLYYLIIIQLMLSIAAYPLVKYFFHDAPFIASILTNLLLVPLATLVIIPAILFTSLLYLILPNAAILIFGLISAGFDLLFEIGKFNIGLEQQLIAWLPLKKSINILSIITTILAIILIFAPRWLPIRYLGFIYLLPLWLIFKQPELEYGEFELTVFDVGQNLAVAIRTQNRHILYDTANDWMGKRVVVPYLRNHNIHNLDLLIISHADSDHIGGADYVTKQIAVGQILSGERQVAELSPYLDSTMQIPLAYCQAGQTWRWDGVIFSILHPDEQYNFNSNDRSCVLKITAKSGSALLTGDITANVEYKLVRQQNLNADLLLAAHHGSKSSSTPAFIAAVAPQVVVFSTGYLNAHRHPHPEILHRYQTQNIKIFNTPETGSLKFHSQQLQQPILAREFKPRIWH
jgi:competence protein ComEC